MISSLIRIVAFTFVVTIVAFAYFALVFGIADYINGVLATRDGAYGLGHRVAFTALMIGPVLGAVMGLNASWNQPMSDLRRSDGSPAWFARIVAIVATLTIVVLLLERVGIGPISTAFIHYGTLSWPTSLVFIGFGFLLSEKT